MRKHPYVMALVAVSLIATDASAQPAPPPPSSSTGDAAKKAEGIVTQPAKDVGITKSEIPPVLVKASDDPYSLAGLKTCRQLVAAIQELNGVLGPDFTAGGAAANENRTERIAVAGGKAVVNSIIPFRGLVREVSGAAPAQRALNAAIDTGYARRGFLRGVHRKQGCKANF